MIALVAALGLVSATTSALAAPYAAFVMDARTGKVLHSENAETRLHPASLTKMMTLYVTFDAIRRGEISLDTMVTVSANAASEPPSKLGLRAGQRISLRNLIRAAAIKSANDAATAIGEAVGGSEANFARRMTATGKALGMASSTFKNAHGLTADGHLSTARDMSILGRRLFYDFNEYYSLFSRVTIDTGVAKVGNTNRRFLESYRGADGIKTGYTSAAGFNLTASAERGNKRIIATVFGGTSTVQRNARMANLLDIGFGNAPANAKVQKPAAVQLDAIASADSGSTSRSSAKTIRVQGTVARSPRPQRRPGIVSAQVEVPAALVAAIKQEVQQTLSGVAASEALASNALAVAPVPVARPEVEIAPEPAVEVAAAEPVPETPELAAPIPFAVIDPDTLPPDSETAVAEAEMPDELPTPQDEDVDALPDNVRMTSALVVPGTPAARPRNRPGEIIMTAANRAPTEEASVPRSKEKPETVARISTAGGRHWAVNLGRFPSRGVAERVLLQTALAETAALDGALRKVVSRGGGFDANFVGLSRDQADLACRRLQARAVQCFALGP
ncbi:MAG: serine hydrolase [Gemmobacter sp.]|nr:serine hydrolase [Gemmobacter sp.]